MSYYVKVFTSLFERNGIVFNNAIEGFRFFWNACRWYKAADSETRSKRWDRDGSIRKCFLNAKQFSELSFALSMFSNWKCLGYNQVLENCF